MRELHDGVELLEQERDGGPFVWRNWDKWVDRCEAVITWLDEQILEMKQGEKVKLSEKWKERGLVCGVEWPIFRQTVEKYRVWLDASFGGKDGIRKQLVFAHNDVRQFCSARFHPRHDAQIILLTVCRHNTETSSASNHQANLHSSTPQTSTNNSSSSTSSTRPQTLQVWNSPTTSFVPSLCLVLKNTPPSP
jgi:hypothetical protein